MVRSPVSPNSESWGLLSSLVLPAIWRVCCPDVPPMVIPFSLPPAGMAPVWVPGVVIVTLQPPFGTPLLQFAETSHEPPAVLIQSVDEPLGQSCTAKAELGPSSAAAAAQMIAARSSLTGRVRMGRESIRDPRVGQCAQNAYARG